MSLVKDSLQSIKPKFIVFWAAYLLKQSKSKNVYISVSNLTMLRRIRDFFFQSRFKILFINTTI